ncbi:MAG: hypothetical protein PVH31_00030 [Ectothiorhodospiraceae bacterium]|jgi:hypothetical protein
MSRENDRIDARLGCVRTDLIPATLISTTGYHCEVWRAVGSVYRNRARNPLDLVIKVPTAPYTLREVGILNREYRMLRRALGTIVPRSLYIATTVNDAPGVVVLAETVNRWFDVANPVNESEAVPLFRRLRRARGQLARFIEAARAWDRDGERVIDLYGLENLVLDANQRLRYIDSFRVFFHADLLYALETPDEDLRERIELSRRRLDYVEHLLNASKP